MFKNKLRKIEEQIIEKINQIGCLPTPTGVLVDEVEEKQLLQGELDALKTQRKFLLDRRESWLPKTLWNVLVPILVTIITLYVINLLGLKSI